MIPFGTVIKIVGTQTQLRHQLGEDIVVVEIGAYAVPDFALALTPDQARTLAEQLMRPAGRVERAFRRPARWLGRLVGRSAK